MRIHHRQISFHCLVKLHVDLLGVMAPSRAAIRRLTELCLALYRTSCNTSSFEIRLRGHLHDESIAFFKASSDVVQGQLAYHLSLCWMVVGFFIILIIHYSCVVVVVVVNTDINNN